MLKRHSKLSRFTRPLCHMPLLCDVPGCPKPAQRTSLGALCSRHEDRFEREHRVFLTEVFLHAETEEEEQRAREECYSRWLGGVARATAPRG